MRQNNSFEFELTASLPVIARSSRDEAIEGPQPVALDRFGRDDGRGDSANFGRVYPGATPQPPGTQ